jgi:signal transduction histidine kinase
VTDRHKAARGEPDAGDALTGGERLGLLAHELRSPVAALLAISESFGERRDRLAPGDRQRLVELALEAARSIERLVSDPKLFSVRLERVDVTRLLEHPGPGVTVSVEPGLTVLGDPVRLRQALANLVANGRRYGAVSLRATEARDEVRLAVSDEGPGVPVDFDLFARGTSGTGSTGYGLYVVREVAASHGGRVEVESSAAGSTFTLVLPSADGRG